MAKIPGGYNIEGELKKRFADYCRSRRLGPVEDIMGATVLWFLDAKPDEKDKIVLHYTEWERGNTGGKDAAKHKRKISA